MNNPASLYKRMVANLEIPGLEIPAAFVRIYRGEEGVPDEISRFEVMEESLMCCQAVRHASQGHPVLLTRDNIGCVAAAVSLGLVDGDMKEPLDHPRVYTEIMKSQSGQGNGFAPPSPAQFTSGEVYACASENLPQFCLFGEKDSGRFKDLETARKAVNLMAAIEPAQTRGVFIWGPDYDAGAIDPDVAVLAVRPVEMTRIMQGWSFITGEAIRAEMGPLRALDSDLIARPYNTGAINVSSFCLGARLVAGFEGDRMGMGIPWRLFSTVVRGMEQSRTGFPFPRYPGADPASTKC